MNLIGLFLVVYHMATSELPGNFVKFGNESPTALMFALGTMMFNMSAVAVILSIDKASPHPESLIKRCGVIEIGIIVPTILSTIFGCYGYYSFGTMEENILRSLPFDDDSAILAISLYMIAIMLAYPIQSFPGIEIALDVYKHLDIIEAVVALLHSWTSATSGLRGLFLITCRQNFLRGLFLITNFFVCEAPLGARPSAVADVADRLAPPLLKITHGESTSQDNSNKLNMTGMCYSDMEFLCLPSGSIIRSVHTIRPYYFIDIGS
ncbi:Proton-coupled amino acid transporter-like protein CG1139 [Eumeta japonica]|uniref:Proton-coupled amino acid transporter-like protein CG1139 n=1 Tax=Eumeta variegata TaxID=151549 RepID=A0A4C1Y537_EUMVA|nr:Proton-coupled amino acid transporter-like protein CG1139 [Eumeta japonica]